MRAVLRTVAQCHSHRILHRDVKPGNFMLLHPGPRAPLKGIGALLRVGGPHQGSAQGCFWTQRFIAALTAVARFAACAVVNCQDELQHKRCGRVCPCHTPSCQRHLVGTLDVEPHS